MFDSLLASIQGFQFDVFDPGGMQHLQSRANTLMNLGTAYLFLRVAVQVIGAWALFGTATTFARSGSVTRLFPPMVWALIGLVSGPWGLLGTGLLFAALHYTDWFDVAAPSPKGRQRRATIGSGDHEARVRKLKAELQELKDASADDLDA